jgi:hypothetical protein
MRVYSQGVTVGGMGCSDMEYRRCIKVFGKEVSWETSLRDKIN